MSALTYNYNSPSHLYKLLTHLLQLLQHFSEDCQTELLNHPRLYNLHYPFGCQPQTECSSSYKSPDIVPESHSAPADYNKSPKISSPASPLIAAHIHESSILHHLHSNLQSSADDS